jgi:beta-glucosidase
LLSAIAALLFVCGAASFHACAQDVPAYKNPKLSVDQRVADLLARMTLEEKLSQIESAWENRTSQREAQPFIVDEKGVFLPDAAKITLKNGIGQLSRPSENPGGNGGPREMAELTNGIQKWVKENTRLGIPVMFHEECLHGHAAPKGTAFPAAIGLASTWDEALIHDVFSSVASEVRARGVQQCLAPVLDLARDPRWGRTEETYGEDPYLVMRIGLAAIHGLQGDGPWIDKAHVMATAKHFAVHGQPEGGTNVGPGNYSERVVREYFLKPFEAAVKEGHVQTVMASYNEIDGIPSHSNKYLLDDILRHEWGFEGMVVSDYFGIRELRTVHHIVAANDVAAKLALESGVDMELPYAEAYPSLMEQVQQGKVSQVLIDRAAARVLRAKFVSGLFEDSTVDPAYAEKITNSTEHQQLALKAAHEAIVLLKNQNNLLPLDKAKYKLVAVIGPNAAELHLGGYSNKPGRGVSVLQAIKDKLGSSSEVLYAEGCKITESRPDWDTDKVVLGDPALNAKRIADAARVAKKADVVILVLGENEQTSREAWAGSHWGTARVWICWETRTNWLSRSSRQGSRRLCFCCTAGRIRSIIFQKMCQRFWTAGISGKKVARRRQIFSSEITVLAANCRLPCRVPWGNCRIITTRSLQRSGDLWTAPCCRFSIWLGAQLHHVQVLESAACAGHDWFRRTNESQCGRHEHGRASR